LRAGRGTTTSAAWRRTDTATGAVLWARGRAGVRRQDVRAGRWARCARRSAGGGKPKLAQGRAGNRRPKTCRRRNACGDRRPAIGVRGRRKIDSFNASGGDHRGRNRSSEARNSCSRTPRHADAADRRGTGSHRRSIVLDSRSSGFDLAHCVAGWLARSPRAVRSTTQEKQCGCVTASSFCTFTGSE
jgi:hypothetical protein